jgi:hypothetical protein
MTIKGENMDGAFAVFCVYCRDGQPSAIRLRGRYDGVGDYYHYMVDLKDGQWVRTGPTYNGKTTAEIIAKLYSKGL